MRVDSRDLKQLGAIKKTHWPQAMASLLKFSQSLFYLKGNVFVDRTVVLLKVGVGTPRGLVRIDREGEVSQEVLIWVVGTLFSEKFLPRSVTTLFCF